MRAVLSSDALFCIEHGNCLDKLKELPDASIDAVVTDPPYELGFMQKKWDASGIAYSVELWTEVLRVLKPGAHLLAFGGTRTYHRMACAIEDAGFEIRDSIHWIYGSGFPKSLSVSKALARFRPNRLYKSGAIGNIGDSGKIVDRTDNGATITAPATEAAKAWDGWGTALKPAHEPIVVARKPLVGTVAENVSEHGTGAINIRATRVAFEEGEVNFDLKQRQQTSDGAIEGAFGAASLIGKEIATYKPEGRWPANVLLGHSEGCDDECAEGCPVAEMDRQSGTSKSSGGSGEASRGALGKNTFGKYALDRHTANAGGFGDSGGASRYFSVFRYCAKPSRKERDAGLEHLPEAAGHEVCDRQEGSAGASNPRAGVRGPRRNTHVTVKPLELMRWLTRLVTPPRGVVLDPFVGSGTTIAAAVAEGFRGIGIERDDQYLEIARARVDHAAANKDKVNPAPKPKAAKAAKVQPETAEDARATKPAKAKKQETHVQRQLQLEDLWSAALGEVGRS